jgi:Peptidase A4 family
MRNRFILMAALATLAAVFVSGANATVAAQASSNWAGYVVSADSTTYTSVTGTWTQPTANCSDSDAGGSSSAFWVGLGGYTADSQALEQVGTSVDCSASGAASYYAWYELVPSASVTIKLTIKPGDTITTSVNAVNGSTIEVQVKDRTRRTSFTKMLSFATPDLTSAEWIAESPSACDSLRCTPVPLTDFGSVSFTRIAAVGNQIGGTLTNPSWTQSAIELVPDGSSGFFPGPDRFARDQGSTAGATPGPVSTDGRSFGVSWQADGAAST